MVEQADYVIIGGGVAGGHAIYEIRRYDKRGRVVVIGQESEFPYDRPPLSKEYLAGKQKRQNVFFKADSYYSRNKVEFIKQSEARSIDTALRRVGLDDGRELGYRTLLLATGGHVRKLQVPGSDLQGIYYLRTIHDCDIIKKASSSPRRKQMVIIGGGFIGCEVAATLRTKGMKVTLIEMASHLLSAAIDSETAEWIMEYHSRKGVDVLLNTNPSDFIGEDGKVKAIQLKDGTQIPADFVVVGIGIIPNTELAERAGLKVDNGILVDEYLNTSSDGIYAAGDAARFYSPLFQRNLRVEHVDVAQKQGKIAGANMTGKRVPFEELPYFFSNQFDIEINAYGDLSKHTAVFRRGKINAKTGFIQFYFEGSLLNGILSVNAGWKDIEKARNLLSLRKSFANPSIVSDESRTIGSITKGIRNPEH